MAGNMSRCLNDIGKITKLMSECQAMGIQCLGPDVNESRHKFSANKKGEVRFGLAAIKGMGDAAAQAIIEERERGGLYKDIFDFVQRVNLSAVNRKALESLALSGGFDSFGIKRESYFGVNAKGDTFVETLLRYGQVYQSEQSQMQNSLFGDMGGVEITTPPVPDAEDWGSMERLKRERDLVGIYISAHPLDDYGVVLRSLCNVHCPEIGRSMDRAAMAQLGEMHFGGIVTGVVSKISRNDKPYGLVTIEDFEGAGELALFGDSWTQWESKLRENYPVYIVAQCQPRFRNNPDSLEMVVKSVEFLSDVKKKNVNKFTIYLDSDIFKTADADADVTDGELRVEDIVGEILDNPGTVPLHFVVHDIENNTNIELKSKKASVDVNARLLNYLDGIKDSGKNVRYSIN